MLTVDIDTEDVNTDYRVEGNVIYDGDYEIEIMDYKVYDKDNPNNSDGEGEKPIIVFFYEVRNISDEEGVMDANYEFVQVLTPIQDNNRETLNDLSQNMDDTYYSGDYSFEKNPEEAIKMGGSARSITTYSLDDTTTPVELRHWLDENVKMTFDIKDKME